MLSNQLYLVFQFIHVTTQKKCIKIHHMNQLSLGKCSHNIGSKKMLRKKYNTQEVQRDLWYFQVRALPVMEGPSRTNTYQK